MLDEVESENLLKVNLNKEYSIVSNIEDVLLENNSIGTESKEKNLIKNFLSDNISNNLSKKEKCLHIVEILSKS